MQLLCLHITSFNFTLVLAYFLFCFLWPIDPIAAVAWHESRRKWVGDHPKRSRKISRDPVIRYSHSGILFGYHGICWEQQISYRMSVIVAFLRAEVIISSKNWIPLASCGATEPHNISVIFSKLDNIFIDFASIEYCRSSLEVVFVVMKQYGALLMNCL